MTRKRFVKLLMAQGYDRNEANEKALCVQREGGSYKEAYAAETDFLRSCKAMVDGICASVQRLSETIGRMAAAFSAGVAAFGEAYAEAMNQ